MAAIVTEIMNGVPCGERCREYRPSGHSDQWSRRFASPRPHIWKGLAGLTRWDRGASYRYWRRSIWSCLGVAVPWIAQGSQDLGRWLGEMQDDTRPCCPYQWRPSWSAMSSPDNLSLLAKDSFRRARRPSPSWSPR